MVRTGRSVAAQAGEVAVSVLVRGAFGYARDRRVLTFTVSFEPVVMLKRRRFPMRWMDSESETANWAAREDGARVRKAQEGCTG